MEGHQNTTALSTKEKMQDINFSSFFDNFKNINNKKGLVNFKGLKSNYENELSAVGLALEEKSDFSFSEDKINTGVLLNVDNPSNFIAYVDSIDWKKTDQMQVGDLKRFVEILISEMKNEYGPKLEKDDRFLDFYKTWPKLIEKCSQINGKLSSAMQNLSKSLQNYKNAAVGEYLREYVAADKRSFLVPFEESNPTSQIPSLANRHRYFNATQYQHEWKEKVFDLLEKISKNSKAVSVYGKVLDFTYRSAKFAEHDLWSTSEYFYDKTIKTGSSRSEMIGVLDKITSQLEKFKNEFESHRII